MAIRDDSYSSVAGVVAYTRHLLDAQSTYNSTTLPTLTEVESFIDEASGLLNVAIRSAGFSPANIRANSTAKLSCDAWVRNQSAEFVEITQRGVGYSDAQGSRTAVFAGMYGNAMEFAETMKLGWKREGITVSSPSHQGAAFTGTTVQADRADPDNTSIQQPKFTQGAFDNNDL